MTSDTPLGQPTRRRVLGWGAVAAVGHFFHRGSPSPDVAGAARATTRGVSPAFILSGGTRSDGTLVHSTLSTADVGATVDLAVWRADGQGHAELVGQRTADGDAIVRHVVSGKSANTSYFAQLVSGGARVGSKVGFTTLPGTEGSWSRRIGVVSCQNNAIFPENSQLA